MDGTTVNTIDSIAYFANRALNKYSLPSIPTERYKKLVGDGARVLVSRMIAEVGGSQELIECVLTEYNSTYDADFLYLTRAYDGIVDILTELKSRGVICTILSNKPDATAKKVSQALFGDLVKICYGGRAGKPLKPDPAGVFEIMDELGVGADEVLYIGDTATDMRTGKSAGLYTVGVKWGFRDADELLGAGADAIIGEPSELIGFVG